MNFSKKYASVYDLFHSDKPYREEAEFVYRWAGNPKSILDLGCGSGQHWRHYPAETKLTGIDKSPEMTNDDARIIHGDIANIRKLPLKKTPVDCVTALFNVINYIPEHSWWPNLPLEKGGTFIFDIWDANKVSREGGFRQTIKEVGGYVRAITPIRFDGFCVDLLIEVYDEGGKLFQETHRMYIFTHNQIKSFCARDFKITEVVPTTRWQTWYKCEKK